MIKLRPDQQICKPLPPLASWSTARVMTWYKQARGVHDHLGIVPRAHADRYFAAWREVEACDPCAAYASACDVSRCLGAAGSAAWDLPNECLLARWLQRGGVPVDAGHTLGYEAFCLWTNASIKRSCSYCSQTADASPAQLRDQSASAAMARGAVPSDNSASRQLDRDASGGACHGSVAPRQGFNQRHHVYNLTSSTPIACLLCPRRPASLAIVTRVAAATLGQISAFRIDHGIPLETRAFHCLRDECDFLEYDVLVDGVHLSAYPSNWTSGGRRADAALNSIFFAKWLAVDAALACKYEAVLLTDLDTMALSSTARLRPYLRPPLMAPSAAVLAIARDHGLPNAGCALIRSGAAGLEFVRAIRRAEHGRWFQEDNGAFAAAIIALAEAHEEVSGEATASVAARSHAGRFNRTFFAAATVDASHVPRLWSAFQSHASLLRGQSRKAVAPLVSLMRAGSSPRPFCVRPLDGPSSHRWTGSHEPLYQPGDWMLHAGQNRHSPVAELDRAIKAARNASLLRLCKEAQQAGARLGDTTAIANIVAAEGGCRAPGPALGGHRGWSAPL